MNADEDSPSKKKVEKPSSSTDNLTVTVDKTDGKRTEKGDEDPKPRIVLTFRSEKSSAKSTNMKIVSTEEKHEEAPRRSSRGRGKWEWICDSETSPKKDKSGAQTTSENDESDSSHTTPKRSTRRRSKDSDNVLANAIARKEKAYETPSVPQRLSRRIKPTAKILANEELRIGLESQNNARLGIQSDKSPEEGVRTRRSARPVVVEEKKVEPEPLEDEVVEIMGTDDDSQSQNTVMKLKHLCELGLKAITPDEMEESGNENREDEENEAEEINEDDEIDDDPNVISKLLETDEDSDEDFHCSVSVAKENRPRRSVRLCSSYGINDSDRSSPTVDDEHKAQRRTAKRARRVSAEDSVRTRRLKRRRKPSSGSEEVHSDAEIKVTDDPAGGDEGSEAACPADESTIVATCFCDTPSNVYAAPEELTEPVFCQAIEMVDGVRVGCSHSARRERGPGAKTEGPLAPLAAMLRAGPRAPYFLSCVLHAAQLAKHMCCPACGLFCTQGTFYQCSSGHLFHVDCGISFNDAKAARPGCPHCGVYSYMWQPVNTDCAKVRLEMKCSNKRIFLPDQREQCTPAYLGFSSQNMKVEQGPIIPKDLLPSPPIELKQLERAPSKSPNQLCEAILKGESVDQLLSKLVSSSHINKALSSQSGGTCVHAAVRGGRVAALYLLQYAGANLDATDSTMRTPLILAVTVYITTSWRVAALYLLQYAGANLDATDSTMRTPLILAVTVYITTSWRVAALYLLQYAGANLDATDSTMRTPLILAVTVYITTSWRVAALYLLQYAGANLDATDSTMRTPLILAVTVMAKIQEKQKESTKQPTEDVDVDSDKESEAPAKTEKADDKSERSDDSENLPDEEDMIKVIRYLLAAGCDINFPGPDGMTALHVCAQLGCARVARLLLTYSATNIDAKDAGGWTPLVWAAENKHDDVVKILLESGADALTSDTEGNYAVHWCALAGSSQALRLLLHAAPRAAHALNAHADTPLHVAARQGHYSCVVVLLARGARTDVENSAGELPVEVCTAQCQSAISLNMQMNIAVRDKVSKYKLLSSDISNGREPFPVPCVNEVDDAALPEDFTYVTKHVLPHPLSLDDTIDTMQGCECKDGDCSLGECACSALGVRCWYTRGRLHASFPYHDPPMLFECNQTCGCNLRRCNNSVVTKASLSGSLCVRAAVFRAGGARGWGLRARAAVPRGAPVALYCGELLALPHADTRPADHYMFALDVKPDLLEQCSDKTQLCVDAAQYGSAARFINHSCKPNLAPVRVFTHCRDLRLPTVALFATTDISPDEEFTFDYGDKFWSVKSKWMHCECGSTECRYPVKTDDTESS
ncbi:histone-lysine N-methyltransferase G9a [Anticarsia gemmatalis]|uniref:histone-lysine N-methyltransferase G9a n=1 Tax=Anticarsia gemmatalis TaxID=129554 RepID=UPI003F76876B